MPASKGGIKLTFRPNMAFSQTMQLFQNHFVERRSKAIQRYITHLAAKTLLEGVEQRIPERPAYRTYRDALRLTQSGVLSNPVFSVIGEVGKKEVVERDTDILYFKPKKKIGKADRAVEILMEHQPWTQDTLPFTPTSDKATLLKRKVSKQDVTEIAKAREKDRSVWTKKLSEAGIRVKRQESKVPAEATALPDILYTAMRLEFGLGGAVAVAHWRPAYRDAKALVKRVFLKKGMDRALLDWEDSRWLKWRDLSASVVSSSAVQDLGEFQSRIAPSE